jgi:hypothetical protein
LRVQLLLGLLELHEIVKQRLLGCHRATAQTPTGGQIIGFKHDRGMIALAAFYSAAVRAFMTVAATRRWPFVPRWVLSQAK